MGLVQTLSAMDPSPLLGVALLHMCLFRHVRFIPFDVSWHPSQQESARHRTSHDCTGIILPSAPGGRCLSPMSSHTAVLVRDRTQPGWNVVTL